MKLKLDYKKCHEGLWNWLAKNPGKWKQDWPGFKTMNKLSLHVPTKCFACAVSKKSDCSDCPVDFGIKKDKEILHCLLPYSYYKKWQASKDSSKYAQLIANGWK